MNEWSRFVQAQMDARGWNPADLARASGNSPQVISRILNDTRERLPRPPARKTVAGFARAFGGGDMERRLWLRVAAAMGLPLGDEVVVADAARLNNDQLVAEISRRLAEPAQQPSRSTTDRQEDAPSIGVLHAADSRQKTRPKAPKRGQQ